MPKQEQYTLEEAKKRAAELGSPWTPTLEAQLRKAGKIADAAPAAAPRGLPWWQEAGAGLGSMIAGPTSGLGGQLDAAQRLATGTTVGEQTTAGALGGLTAGNLSPEALGIPAPASVVQRGANLFGQGAGMAAAFTPIAKGAGMAASSVANPLLRAAATGALSFGAYNAAAPAEGLGERLQNVGEGALTGAVLGPLPMLPGVKQVAALPGGRTAVDLAAFTGLGVVHGQDPATALVEALPQLAAMKMVHGAAEQPRNAGRPTPEQVAAEIEALEARLTNERAPMQAEVSARVAPFREAQANAQGLQTPATAAEYNRLAGPETLPPRGNAPEVDAAARERAQAVQAETLARERADYEAKKAFEADFRQRMEAERQRRLAEEAAVPPLERPLQPEIKWSPDPAQYSRTEARIAAMRARQAAPPAPAPAQPPVRTPAQIEIPENRTILLRPDGTVEPAPQRPPMDVGTGTPPEKPVFTGPVVEGEAIPGNMAESAQRYAYESTMRDAAERRASAEKSAGQEPGRPQEAGQTSMREIPQPTESERMALREMFDAADDALPHSAGRLVRNWVGHEPRGRDHPEWGGDASPQYLGRALRDGSPEVGEIESIFSPVRERLKNIYGNTVRLYRYQVPEAAIDERLPATSWSLERKFPDYLKREHYFRGGEVLERDVPLDDVLWATDRANQMEFIVREKTAAPSTAAEAPPVKETRGQRRARLQAEASQVNAEAARRMGTDIGQEPVAVAPEATQNNVELTSRNRLVKPITGKTGSSIVGYQWMSMTEEGMFRDRKVSDWTRSQKSEPTGRDIVHVFFVRSPDGAIKVMGVGAAQKALGISTDRLYSIAKAEQQMARQRVENQNKDEIRISEKVASASPAEAARKWRTTNGADADIRKTTLLEKGGKFFRTLDANLVETLKDRGWAEATSDPVRKSSTDMTLGMGGGQQVFEAVGRALKDVAAEVKDTPRRMRNIKAAADTDFEAARAELVKNVNENPVSVPFSRANRGEQTYEQAVNDVVSMPRRVRKLTDLRAYPDKATEGVKDIIDTDNLAALRADISKPLAARLDQAPGSDLPEKQRGLTDPVRKTQETMDGELASAVEMSEIHGGREIEMATYKQAAEFGSQYKDLKKRTGVTGTDQLEIAGRLLENYTSRNRGHVGNDLEFVQDPANRQLLAESGNPQGMFEYVKGVRELMDSAGNLYNKASRGMGGEGMGDIAAYFPKVGVKPKFFEVGERLARAKARKGADPRTRNTADQVFNPRSQRRSTTDPNKVEMDGREIAREWNAETVLEGYLDTMLRGVSGDIALSQSMKAAKYDDILADRAERAGNQQEADNRRRRADVIRTLAQQKWNHQLFGVGESSDAWFKKWGQPGQMALEGIAANKRTFDNTKYRLNPRFNLVTQWTSILNPSMADPVAAMLALRDMGVPGLPTEAKKFAESTYEFKRKAMPHSQMRSQAEGTGSITETLNAPISGARKTAAMADKVFVDGLTHGIENWANKYSALIGYHSTRNLQGLTPRQRALAAGQTVFKTQSAFTFGERAGVLNSRAVQGLYPAQGYAVELANQIREALGATGVDTKLYGETGLQQTRRAGAIVAAAVMQNVWQNIMFNWMRGKDPSESLTIDSIWDATLALPPFIGLVLPSGKGGRDMPNPALPIAQGNMMISKGKRFADKVIDGEPADEAATDLARYWAGNWMGRGGALTSDILGSRYDFMFGDDEGADAPNTVRSRPVAPRTSRGRQAIPRR